jgi:hypothetical protein
MKKIILRIMSDKQKRILNLQMKQSDICNVTQREGKPMPLVGETS